MRSRPPTARLRRAAAASHRTGSNRSAKICEKGGGSGRAGVFGRGPMRVRLFTFRYSATLGGFDDTALREFIRDKEVLSFREHFFAVNEVPHLACVLIWQDAIVSAEQAVAVARLPIRARAVSCGVDSAGRRRSATGRADPGSRASAGEPNRLGGPGVVGEGQSSGPALFVSCRRPAPIPGRLRTALRAPPDSRLGLWPRARAKADQG